VAELVDAPETAWMIIIPVKNHERLTYTGSSPVLTAEGANPETLKDKVGDSWNRQQHGSIGNKIN
jgi:hypothetical protein